MKTITKIIAVLLLTVTPFILTAQAQPWNSGIVGSEGTNTVGGGAPITGGFLILLSLGIGYGAKKVYDYRKRILE
ncbi:MAG: hypothetical protein K8R58_06280 [Bacteroidales bacterium]|nr:hypothetical protein [Bacteroidales bacterium]